MLHDLLNARVLLIATLVIFSPIAAQAQTYSLGQTVTNTTGTFSLAPHQYGLTSWVEVYKNGVIQTFLAAPPITLTDVANGSYEYRYIWEFALDPWNPSYYEMGSVFVTVSRQTGSQVNPIAPFPQLAAASTPGRLSASISVGTRGNMSLGINLALPSGVNGLGPQLMLSFGGGYAPDGPQQNDGWRIEGLSSIQKCEEDMQVCLSEGGRLVSENPELVPQPVGQRYRAKRQSDVLVIRQADGANKTWYLAKRNGRIYRYGSTDQGRKLDAYGQPTEWYLQEVEDEFGNKMTIDYQALSTAYADKVPVLISFGGYRVEFVYGQLVNQPKIGLHTIRSVVNTKTASEYRLIRGGVDQYGNVVVNAVQQCGYTTSGALEGCLAPTTVQSSYVDSKFRVTVTDGNGVKQVVDHVLRGNLSSSNAVFAGTEVPFAMPALLPPPGSGYTMQDYTSSLYAVTEIRADDGLGGVTTETYAYRSAELNNDTIRQRLADGSYLYTSYLVNWGPASEISGVMAKQARYSGIAGASGSVRKSFVENDWQVLLWDKHSGTRPTDVGHYLQLQKQRQHILDDYGAIVGGRYQNFANTWNTLTGLLSQTVVTTKSGYDSSGLDINANLQATNVATTIYSNDAANWIVGFVTSDRSEGSVPNRSGVKGARTDFSPYVGYYTHKIGTIASYSNDGQGWIARATTTMYYDAKGNPSSSTVSGADFSPRSTTFGSYVDDRFVRTITQPTGTGYLLSNQFDYDARFGAVATITDVSNSLTNTTDRDSFGRTVIQVTPNGSRTTTTRTMCTATCGSARSFDAGQPKTKIITTVTHPSEANKGAPNQVVYLDDHDRVIRVETEGFASGQWSAVDSVYNSIGQIVKRSLPYQISAYVGPAYQTYGYDTSGRLASIAKPDGGSVLIDYQQLADRTRVTTTETAVGLGGTRTKVRVEDYNSLGKLFTSYDGYGSVDQVATAYEYDQTQNADRVTVNGDSRTTVYSDYDGFGRKTSVLDVNFGLKTFHYDGLGQLRSQINADGQVVDYSYDLIGRLYRRVDDSTGNPVINQWTFDTRKVGYLSTRSKTGFGEDYYYDGYAQVQQVSTSISDPSYVGTFSSSIVRDSYGRAKSVSYPSGVIAGTTYNSQGYASETRDIRTNALLSRIDAVSAFGSTTQHTLGNGLITARSFDSNSGRLSTIQTGGGTIQNEIYDWWSDGSLFRRRKLNVGASETFAYDSLDRLDSAATSASVPRNLDYAYDKLGNLTHKMEAAAVPSYSYNVFGKPQQFSNATVNGVVHQIGYDAKGNITQTDAPGVTDDRTMSYDVTGKVTSIVRGALSNPEAREEFRYDPDGFRYIRLSLNKSSGTAVTDRTIYLYQGAFERILPGQGSITAIDKSYVGDVLHIRKVESGVPAERLEFLHSDHLGSIVAVTDSNQVVVDQRSFDPFGGLRANDWSGGGSPPSALSQQLHTARGFTGHEQLHSVGLIHMNGRVYDPIVGKFLSADPHVTSPTYSQSYNRYGYVVNNPLRYVDPTGFDCQTIEWDSWLPPSPMPDSQMWNHGIVIRHRAMVCFDPPSLGSFALGPDGSQGGGNGGSDKALQPGHNYRADNRICARALTDDEKRVLINKFTVPSAVATSFMEGNAGPKRNEEGYYLVTTTFGLPGGIVNTTFSDDGLVGQNVTTPVHGLVGTVQREVVNRSDGAYMTTHGFGTAPPGIVYIPQFNALFSIGEFRDRMNDKYGPVIFNSYDKQVARYAKNHFKGC